MTLKQQQDRNITMLKGEFERKAGEVHKIFEKAMKTASKGCGNQTYLCNNHAPETFFVNLADIFF